MHEIDPALHEVVVQFQRYCAHPARRREALTGGRTGQGWARLLAHDLRSVRFVDDHAAVAERLAAAGEVELLVRVVASGLLHGLALRFYRLALATGLGS